MKEVSFTICLISKGRGEVLKFNIIVNMECNGNLSFHLCANYKTSNSLMYIFSVRGVFENKLSTFIILAVVITKDHAYLTRIH